MTNNSTDPGHECPLVCILLLLLFVVLLAATVASSKMLFKTIFLCEFKIYIKNKKLIDSAVVVVLDQYKSMS
jgi:hypothetical protein